MVIEDDNILVIVLFIYIFKISIKIILDNYIYLVILGIKDGKVGRFF